MQAFPVLELQIGALLDERHRDSDQPSRIFPGDYDRGCEARVGLGPRLAARQPRDTFVQCGHGDRVPGLGVGAGDGGHEPVRAASRKDDGRAGLDGGCHDRGELRRVEHATGDGEGDERVPVVPLHPPGEVRRRYGGKRQLREVHPAEPDVPERRRSAGACGSC